MKQFQCLGLAAMAALFCATAACAGDDRWTTYHGDYALQGLCTQTVSQLAPAWTFRADSAVKVTPVGADGLIFFYSDQQRLYALSLTGTQVWSRTLNDTNGVISLATPPVLADSLLIVGTAGGKIVALDSATGELRWEYDTQGSLLGSPTIEAASGRLFVISQSDGALHGVSLRDGKPVWTAGKTNRSDGSLATAGGRLVYGNCDAALYIVSAENGKPLGSLPLGQDSQVAGGVALSGNFAFSGSRSGRVFCADLKTTRLVWTNTATAGEVFSTPAVNEKIVVFGGGDSRVYCADRSSGKTLWQTETAGAASSPVLVGGGILVSAGGKLYWLSDADGRVKATQPLSDGITPPAIVGPLAIVGGDNGVVTAFAISAPAEKP